MKKTKNCTNLTKPLPENAAFCRNALFLDIETTGFSPSRNRIYLIGTAYFETPSDTRPDTDSKLVTEQFFAENPDEEPALLFCLKELFSRFDTVITFHGSRFDLPFIQERGKRLGTDLVYDNKYYVDLYQFSFSFRHIFCLENYKQKTIEKFLGIEREDVYDGGELVKQYQEYMKHPGDTVLHLLLKHNYEDVLGMAGLLSLYAFESFFQGGFTPVQCKLAPCHKLDGSAAKELLLDCQLSEPLPAPVSCHNSSYYLHAEQKQACFRVPVTEGSLKYFFADYKNYYYLPQEDTAIHKSVAAFVDKSCRQKAKAADCYSRKDGMFLPQYEEVVSPSFYVEYKDSISYFEWTDASAKDSVLLKKFCMHMLEILKAGK